MVLYYLCGTVFTNNRDIPQGYKYTATYLFVKARERMYQYMAGGTNFQQLDGAK